MKKILIFLCTALFIILMPACSRQEPTLTSDSDVIINSSTPSESNFNHSSESDTAQPDATDSGSLQTETQSGTTSSSGGSNSGTGNSSSSSTPGTTPTGSSTAPPTSTQQPPATSTPKPPATTEPPPVSTDPPKPAFNAQTYYDYALSYGKSVGLIFDGTLNIHDHSWNAPLNLYDDLTDDNMKSGVRTSCDRIKREGFEYFGLYLEKQANGTSYRLYVIYA